MQISTTKILEQSRKISLSSIQKINKKESILKKEITFSMVKSKNKLKSRFFSEIAVLLSSGIDLKKSLEILLGGMTKNYEKKIIEDITTIIIKGGSLSLAMEKSSIFSVYDYYSVKIGEESGSLSIVLKELAIYYQKKISQQRQIKGALTYPILVLCTTILSLIFMLNFIVPMFKEVFLRFKGNLPQITRTVISLSDSFSKYFLISLLVILSLSIFFMLNRKKLWSRRLFSFILIKIPVIGPIIKLTYKIRFCGTLKLLLNTKVHLLDALNLIIKMIGFYPLEKALEEIKSKIAKGINLSEAMEPFAIFDKKLIAMTRVAEEVNKLEQVYEELFKQYSEELDVRIKTMNNLLEPVLIIFVGGLVALILISMYMPIFQLGTSIN